MHISTHVFSLYTRKQIVFIAFTLRSSCSKLHSKKLSSVSLCLSRSSVDNNPRVLRCWIWPFFLSHFIYVNSTYTIHIPMPCHFGDCCNKLFTFFFSYILFFCFDIKIECRLIYSKSAMAYGFMDIVQCIN